LCCVVLFNIEKAVYITITWIDDNMDRSSMWVKWALACPKKIK